MDLELARTFLEVVAARSFVAAAETLHVTQSTVSMRIRQLEQQLNVRLFVRNRDGAVLTSAGTQFQRHATALVRVWQQARQDLALPRGFRTTLRIGGEAGLWNRWLHDLVPWMRQNAAEIALRCEVGLAEGMTHALIEGLLDIAVTYSPQSRPGLTIIRVAEEELVMVETRQNGDEAAGREQIYVDWGEEFRRQHRMTFPDFPIPALFIGLGTLGFDYLLRNGGAGYFPKSLAAPACASGAIRVVPGAPNFVLPVFAAHAAGAEKDVIDTVLRGIAGIVTAHQDLGEPAASAA